MIIGIDPGKDKCGIAVVRTDLTIEVKEVLATAQLISRLKGLKDEYNIEQVILGDGTKSKLIQKNIESIFTEINIIDESHSTLEARSYYWQENPPTGWRRLIPTSLQTPPKPIDDYVAVILVQRYLNN